MSIGRYRGRWVAYDYALDMKERSDWEKELGVRSDFFYRHHPRRD